MNKIKIAVVEDEIIIAKTIVLALEAIGYEVAGTAGKYREAMDMIAKSTPDLILLDINLGTKKDGIDLAFEVKNCFETPVIFLTANSDPATIKRAKEINPLAFLVKPFSQNDLYSAIEIGWNNFNKNLYQVIEQPKHIVLKVGATYEKVIIDDITYLKNDHHYFDIHLTSGKKVVVRYTTSQMIKLLPIKQFVQINRFHIVNINQITKIESKLLYLDHLKFLISKAKKEELLLMI